MQKVGSLRYRILPAERLRPYLVEAVERGIRRVCVNGPAWLLLNATEYPSSRDWLSPREAEQADAFRFPKRRAEWLLGRLAAKRALAALLAAEEGELGSWRPGRLPLRFSARRAPPVTLSLSHRAGVGSVAVRPGADALGCDVELVERRSEAFVRDYLDADERARVEARHADRDWLVPLLWSAKGNGAFETRSASGSRSTRARSASAVSTIAKAKAGVHCASS